MEEAPGRDDFGVRLNWPQDSLADPLDALPPADAPGTRATGPDRIAAALAGDNAAGRPGVALGEVSLGVAEISAVLRRMVSMSRDVSSELGAVTAALRRMSSQSANDAAETQSAIDHLANEVRRLVIAEQAATAELTGRLADLETHMAGIAAEVSAIRRRTRVAANPTERKRAEHEGPAAPAAPDDDVPGRRGRAQLKRA